MPAAPAGKTRLGVNIDHVATLRRLRDTPYPDLVRAAEECIAGGADQITIHLREDRRHILDRDVADLKKAIAVPLSLEMAATEEMLRIALEVKPYSLCIVPEKREERTTEGGLDLSRPERNAMIEHIASSASRAGILPSFFIEPTPQDAENARKFGAKAVEFHTGSLCLAVQAGDSRAGAEWARLEKAIQAASELGLQVHAGHGIDEGTAVLLAEKFPQIEEYNIGHSIVCQAVFHGIRQATARMKTAIQGRAP